MTQTAALRDKTGAPVPFLGANVEAIIGDALATTRITQRYRNAERRPIEVVYTFPLPDRAALLAFEVEFGGRKFTGRIIETVAAARRYEEAIDAGDSAVLVQSHGQGLFSANIGNLLAGEEASITIHYALENRWQDGHLAWRLPTVIAPRYGDSGLPAEHEPVSERDADHRATVSIVIEGAAATADITSPSHEIGVDYENGHARVRLLRGDVAMDRDIVLSLRHHGVVSTAQMAPDGDGVLVWASFIPNAEAWASDQPIALDILLDCSGSMQGTSISTAREALERIIAQLTPRDRFNLIRFGSDIEPLFPKRVEADDAHRRRAEAVLRVLQADLGGTEIQSALQRVWYGGEPSGDVILITDGHVYGGDTLIDEAKSAGRRIFSIGVGSQVQEQLVRGLAEATGGAAELISPGEAMASAIARQFRRIKAGAIDAPRLDWDTPPVTEPALPRSIFAGDTVHVTARFSASPGGVVTLSARRADGRPITARIDLGTARLLDGEAAATLLRIDAARRLAELARSWRACQPGIDREALAREGLALALEHALLSPWTGMIVVRENAERIGEAPPTRVVVQMAPAGMEMLAALKAAPTSRGAPSWSGRSKTVDTLQARHPGLGTPTLHRASPAAIARQRFVSRLRSHLRKRGMPQRIDELLDLRLEAALETLLRRLARSYAEADVVRTFVELLTGAHAATPEGRDPLVDALRAAL